MNNSLPITNIRLTRLLPSADRDIFGRPKSDPCYTYILKWNVGEKEYGNVLHSVTDLPDEVVKQTIFSWTSYE